MHRLDVPLTKRLMTPLPLKNVMARVVPSL